MKMRTATIIGSALLLVVLTALAGPAYAAGNGKGNGQGNATTEAPVAASPTPGKSADAPGQVKKEHEPPVTGASVVHSAGPNGSGSDHAKSGSGGSAGAKPSSSTDHNVSAAAGSNATKLYGNGQTAGQIAIRHGASTEPILYGPGNSQPHKVLPRGHSAHGKGGGPDVPALKNKGQTVCGSKTPPAKSPGDPPPPSTTPQTTGSTVSVAGAAKGGVRSSVANVGKGTLPFTGFPLWSAALIALALAGTGLTLRRHARQTV
jgi:hypothetical protein